ncbi:hypothetical protein JYT97_02630 [Haliea sp. AH-315-K21]|uniref:Transmembrane anchor protein n=1 Tax=SAR86 cluster bacterium TaxID=2030880 RepID=A0A2A5C8L8_9GAMM|nr:hypothetical protein [Haliea sp. AH-315-K21]PCJ40234.1 MAG: hypothetical protein COA71_12050 [SAR86 cluster bacterium]
MSENNSNPEVEAPSTANLLKATTATIIGALVLLVLVVLPAEYGIDPTGFGELTGLNDLAEEPYETIEIIDIIGGNEVVREIEIPMFGDPVALPNPSVFQDQTETARTMSMTIELGAFEQTEIKTVLDEGKVIIYSWEVVGGENVYFDFHGHEASFGPDFFVRYKERQEGLNKSSGSLTAPFYGEHGWLFLNINEEPVTITLNVTGYYNEIIDYGIF